MILYSGGDRTGARVCLPFRAEETPGALRRLHFQQLPSVYGDFVEGIAARRDLRRFEDVSGAQGLHCRRLATFSRLGLGKIKCPSRCCLARKFSAAPDYI